MEQFDLGALQEDIASNAEVSEKEKKKVQENNKKAFVAHQAVKKSQQANAEISHFIAKVVIKFFNSQKVIEYLFDYIKNIEEDFSKIKVIFQPILSNKFKRVWEYLDYLNAQKNSLTKEDFNLIFEIIKSEEVGTNWDNLKAQWKYDEFIQNIEAELRRILS